MATKGEIKEVKKKYKNVLLNIPYVIGVGIGSSSPGKREKELYLCVYVEKHPEIIRTILAKEIEGVKIAVIETGKVVAY